MKLLIATHNEGKKAEYSHLLAGLGFELTSLSELDLRSSVREDGTTYTENALLKARVYAAAAGLLTLADDSGLEVEALGGAPGVHSARYAGRGTSDEERCRLLLANMAEIPDDLRAAQFRCVIALAWPDGRTEISEGTCKGRITHEPRGENGFGYDPVFYVPEHDCTMAELPAEVKNRIGHRARAAAGAREILKRALG